MTKDIIYTNTHICLYNVYGCKTGFHRSQITCTDGKLLVNALEIDNMVMYVTKELLYHDEKFISREEGDGIIAHYNNVRLTCPAEEDRDLISCEFPKDELKLSNFITRDGIFVQTQFICTFCHFWVYLHNLRFICIIWYFFA